MNKITSAISAAVVTGAISFLPMGQVEGSDPVQNQIERDWYDRSVTQDATIVGLKADVEYRDGKIADLRDEVVRLKADKKRLQQKIQNLKNR